LNKQTISIKYLMDNTTYKGWDGDLLIGAAFAIFHGTVAADTKPHKHYASQLVYSEEDTVQIERAGGAVEVGCELFIPSNEPHRLIATSSTVRILFFEPGALMPTSGLGALKTLLSSRVWRSTVWPDHLAFTPGVDPRIRAALDYLAQHIDRPIGAAELAATTGLSRSRFMALFSHELGIPVRQYILWIRLKQAAASIYAGATITQAAHDAGFSDLAHFSRTMRSTFGVTASESLKQMRITLT
jgi:AraC-like DNA-binding protein